MYRKISAIDFVQISSETRIVSMYSIHSPLIRFTILGLQLQLQLQCIRIYSIRSTQYSRIVSSSPSFPDVF